MKTFILIVFALWLFGGFSNAHAYETVSAADFVDRAGEKSVRCGDFDKDTGRCTVLRVKLNLPILNTSRYFIIYEYDVYEIAKQYNRIEDPVIRNVIRVSPGLTVIEFE